MPPRSRSVFTLAENAILRSVVERLIDEYGNQSLVAERLGVTQPTVSAFMIGRQGASLGLARAIARLVGKTLDELLPPGSAPPATAVRDEVVDAARRLGLSDPACGRLASYEPPLDRNGREPDATFYLRLVCLFEDEERRRALLPVPLARQRA